MQANVFVGAGALAMGLAMTASSDAAQPASTTAAPLADWPRIESPVKTDAALEARIARILAGMTLAEKIGQMTQPEIKAITPDEVRRYYIGSVLNGGGSWPSMNKHATRRRLAEAWPTRTTMPRCAPTRKTPIPVIWGTDAVHGHSNVFGATLFPHNIGLGAAQMPALVERIGQATGASHARHRHRLGVRADAGGRAGRALGPHLRKLLLRSRASCARTPPTTSAACRAICAATARWSRPRSTTSAMAPPTTARTRATRSFPLREMINMHGQGYYGALGAGVQTVMASFNSWNDVAAGVDYGKMHGTHALLTVALKQKMGFDGLRRLRLERHRARCRAASNASCPQAINAGIDMVMVPDDWKAFIANTTQAGGGGRDPDGAHRRCGDAHPAREAARGLVRSQAVRRPLRRQGIGRRASRARARSRARIAGAAEERERRAAAASRARACWWSARAPTTCQPGRRLVAHVAGHGQHERATIPTPIRCWPALREALGADHVTFDASGENVDASKFDAVVAVIGETPYAETNGDIIASETMSHSRRFPADLAAVRAAAATGKPVVTVLLSGRPLYTNDLLNLSNAFVAAWWPGSEGGGHHRRARRIEGRQAALRFPGPPAVLVAGLALPCAGEPARSEEPAAVRARCTA